MSKLVFCRNCERYGHVSSVCRRNVVEESESVQCYCDGNHLPNSPECLVRVKEYEVARVRAIQQVSYTEAREIVEGAKGAEDIAVDTPQTVEIQCCSTVEGN